MGNKGKNNKQLYSIDKQNYYMNVVTELKKEQEEKNNKNTIEENAVVKIEEQKGTIVEKIINNKWNIIAILLSFVVFLWTIKIDNNTMRNLNMNYILETTEIAPLLMKGDDTIFNLNPYVYNLNKTGDSGEYANMYFSRIDSEGVLIKKIRNGTLSYFDFELDKSTEESLNDKQDIVPSYKLRKYDIKLFYAKNNQELPISIFHILLKGYNGSYQFFTIINYVSNIEEDIIEIEGKKINSEFIKLEAKIITDEEVYDNDILHDVIVEISGSKYANNSPYKSYKDLQSKIIDERNKIKESLK